MDYRELIRDTQVHGTLYTSPEVYADELERIWYSTWVFVGHASEVPEPNDYVRKKLGPQDVIMTRDSAGGEVHLLLNRCAHRGGTWSVTTRPATPPRSAAPPTTAGRTGTTATCSATPYPNGYGGKNKLQLGLGRVPRVAEYRGGFVFGSFAEEGPSSRSTSARPRARSTGWPGCRRPARWS